MQKSAELALQARQIARRAEVERRGLSAEERAQFDGLLDAATERKSYEAGQADIGHLSGQLGPVPKGCIEQLAGDPARKGQLGPVLRRGSLLRGLRRQWPAGLVEPVQRRLAVGDAGGGHQRDPRRHRPGRRVRSGRGFVRQGWTASRGEQLACGWFDLGLADDEVVFSLSESGVTALELDVPLAEAKEALN